MSQKLIIRAKIQILEKKREKFLEESEHLQKRIQETAAKKDEFVVEASSVRQKINEEGDILQALKGKMRLKESKIRDLQSEISNQDSKRRGMERSRGSFEQRKQRIIEQIAKFEEESQCEKRKEEAAATQVKMEKITNKETELVERLRLAQQERDELQRLHEQAVSDQNEAVRESRKVSTQVNELEQELHRSEITAKNAVMRFGESIPKILEIMNANADKFEHVPRGPIGMYMKLRDRKWTFAVEEATRRLLTSFVFHSKRDHQTFERMMRANRVTGALPNAIFTRFTTPPHDVRANEPSSEWETILRVVEITDNVVRNVLIDMASVEGTVLLNSDQDARRIMDGMCPDKCVRAYTTTGGMAMGRNRRGEGFYRFYACRTPPRAVLLSEQDASVDSSAMKAELKRLQDKSKGMQERIKKATAEAAQAQRELGKALQSYSAIETDLNRLRSQYRSLERRLEQLEMDDDMSVVENMRKSLDELNIQIAELEEEFLKLDERAFMALVEGLSGVVAAGNFSRYELKFPRPMRIVLESVEGDADLYFSYTNQGVSFELDKHDASSATCGLDYIDVASYPRPSYLAVYGHPFKNESSYRLLIMVVPDGNFEHGPELIHRWAELVQHDSGGNGRDPIYMDILSGILEILVEILL
ncbi:hypothetical protein ANCCEY_14725 [Ancylostoma ceylanicum]|uniref:SMC hinge domain-containing protein n=1 Tax=Ancylostoma ceylanicum TaxID=53326 RepID=A0A0D6L519_9BILA|nr:hypothetical protein ANCCEY_14725 [Ancylostoma ceylanicum]